MSVGFLLPAAFAALAALLLPLLLHLTRRSEQKLTRFAALRWLSAAARPRRKLRFDEYLLLLLRLLLIATLAVLLAQPVVLGTLTHRSWVVVLPGVTRAAARSAVRDSAADAAEWRWLAPGFPPFALPAPAAVPPLSSLLRELDAGLPADTALTVLLPAQVGGLDGARPMLARAVDWRIVTGQALSAAPAYSAPLRTIAVRYARDDEPALRYVRAALAAWNAGIDQEAGGGDRNDGTTPAATRYTMDPGLVPKALDARAGGLIWLAPGELPESVRAWIRAGGVALVDAATQVPEVATGVAIWRNPAGEVRVRGAALGDGRVMRFAQPLRPETFPELLEPGFAQRLRALFETPAASPSRATAQSLTSTAADETGPRATVRVSSPVRLPRSEDGPQLVQALLALLVAALFAAERVVASAAQRWRRAA